MPGAGGSGTSGWLESGYQPYQNPKAQNEGLIVSGNNMQGHAPSYYGQGYAGNSASSVASGYGGSGYYVSSSSGGGYGDYLALLKQISQENNQFNLEQTKMVNEFNAQEALKNREWQERMSRNAHQYEVADLLAAGLNPVLSAGGQGAYVGSGAVASGQKAVADTTYGQGVMHMMTAMINAASAERVASIYTAASTHNQALYVSALKQNTTASLLGRIGSSLLYALGRWFSPAANITKNYY